MPKSFSQIVEEHGGERLFSSDQSDIFAFLGGPMLSANWEGMCLALVMMWLQEADFTKRPNAGIKNKVSANSLQQQIESSPGGASFANAVAIGKVRLGKTYWYQSPKLMTFAAWSDPAGNLQLDPGHAREGFHMLILYLKDGGAHAVGIRRRTNGDMVLYDPNNGAAKVTSAKFASFLSHFLYERYQTDGTPLSGYAIAMFCG